MSDSRPVDVDARSLAEVAAVRRPLVALDWPDVDVRRALLVVLAAWAIAMIAPEMYRVFGSLGSFGLVANNDGVVVDVVGPFTTPAESPAAAAGIVAGDRVDLEAMRCVPISGPRCRSLLRLIGGLGGAQIVRRDSAIELVMKPAAGGPSKIVRLHATPTTRGWGDRLVLLADTLVGILVILAAARLVWLHPGAMTWGFFLYAIWFNPGQTFAYYALLQPWPVAIFAQEILEALAHGAGYAGLLIFALRFPGNAQSAPRRYEWIAVGIGAAIAAAWLASFTNAFGAQTETLASTAFLLGYALDAVVLFVLVRRRRALPAPDRQRMLWVICGCAIGLPAFIFAEIAQSTSLLQHAFGVSVTSVVIGLLYLVNGVLVYFVSIAVLRRRVVSVSIPLRYGTILTVLSLAVGVPIVNLHELLSHYQGSFRIPEWVWLLVVAPIALVLLQRLHELGVRLVDRVLNRRFHAARSQLEDAGMAMIAAQRFDEIDRLLVTSAVQALELSSGAAFRKQDGAFRRTFALAWDDSSGSLALTPDRDAAILRCVERCTPVRLPRDHWDGPDLVAKLREPCIALPVCSDVLGPVAIALFGAHENGNDVDADECEMLVRLARRAADGYERAAFVALRHEVDDLRSRLRTLQGTPA